MSFNGSGTFNINSTGNPVVTGTTISSTWANALTADLATGLTTTICKDGQTTTTALVPFSFGIQFAADSTLTANAAIQQTAIQGLALTGVAGSSYDMALMNPAGTQYLMRNPTGTTTSEFPNTILATGGIKSGSSTVGPIATATPTTAIAASSVVISSNGLGIFSMSITNLGVAYQAVTFVKYDGTNYSLLNNANGGSCAISLSGSNIQVSQSSGSNQTVTFNFLTILP